MEKIISFQNIEVAPYIVEQLLDVRIDQQMNEHGTFYFKALLPEEKKDSYGCGRLYHKEENRQLFYG